jgi:hypothetical protein
MKSARVLGVLALALHFTATASAQTCDPADPAFVCALTNAEDLVRLPGTSWVVASHINFDLTARPPRALGLGPVEAVRIDTRKVQRLYPTPDTAVDWDSKTYPDCAPPPQTIGSAGLNIRPLGGTSFRLYAVNRNGRQSVEVIDIAVRGERLASTWRGCIHAPDYILSNSVVPLPDGAIALSGNKVAIWRPGRGWSKVASYTGNGSNGIEASRDGQWLYVADPAETSVVRVPVSGGAGPSVLKLPSGPDNLRWGDDGHLYATGGLVRKEWQNLSKEARTAEFVKCTKQVVCDTPFTVIRIDPSTFTAKEVFRSPENGMIGRFGAATVALQMHDQIWVGTVHGDRVAVVSIKE